LSFFATQCCHGRRIEPVSKGLCVTAKDYFTTLSRQRLDDIFNRATPFRWMQYSNAKMALTMLSQNQNGPPIASLLRQKLYINDRNPNRISIHDTSRLKVGRNSFHNRLKCLKRINFNWNDISHDTLRINLKKTFFNQRWKWINFLMWFILNTESFYNFALTRFIFT